MKNKMTEYPIGATWSGRDERGWEGRIWLSERREMFEVWKWNVVNRYGEVRDEGIKFSYRICREQMNILWSFPRKIRFKRVK